MSAARDAMWILFLFVSCAKCEPASAQSRTLKAAVCHQAVIEGEVKSGEGFERKIGSGLEVWMQPIAAGWVLKIVPAVGPKGAHDYAELATPPYRSINPLLISTDFNFRAQDVVGWNPRRFHFAASATQFAALSQAFARYTGTTQSASGAQVELARQAARAADGLFEIVDASLIPGTADQVPAAAMVAAHFATTAHRLEQTAGGQGTPLGRVTWMRFRLSLELPTAFQFDPGINVRKAACP